MKRVPKYLQYIAVLWIVYDVVAVACVMQSGGQSASDLIVNFGILLVDGIVLGVSTRRLFSTGKFSEDLVAVSNRIEQQSKSTNNLLWDQYKNSEELFSDKQLSGRYQAFKAEMNRLSMQPDAGYHCDIEDYINYDLAGDVIHKNTLSLVAGAMTGLGILGTFIGLTLGLLYFRTDSADAITKSIPPLIDGIKVAFYTSIFGMIFSLVFNFIYKRILGIAYQSVDLFLDTFKEKVLPDTQNDSMNQMLAYEKRQAENMTRIMNSVGDEISVNITKSLQPYMDSMQSTIQSFATIASQNQAKELDELVSKFIGQMNSEIGQNFQQLGNILQETGEWQKKNNEQMRDIMQQIKAMSRDSIEINNLSRKTIEGTSQYISQIDGLQKNLNNSFDKLNQQTVVATKTIEKQQQYIAELTGYEKTISEKATTYIQKVNDQMIHLQNMEKEISDAATAQIEKLAMASERNGQNITKAATDQIQILQQLTAKMNDQVAALSKVETEFSGSIKSHLNTLTDTALKSNKTIADSAKDQVEQIQRSVKVSTDGLNQATDRLTKAYSDFDDSMISALNTTFDTFDQGLTTISNHLSGTITKVDNTTDRVPKVVEESYAGMEKSFLTMKDNVETLSASIYKVNENLQRDHDIIMRALNGFESQKQNQETSSLEVTDSTPKSADK